MVYCGGGSVPTFSSGPLDHTLVTGPAVTLPNFSTNVECGGGGFSDSQKRSVSYCIFPTQALDPHHSKVLLTLDTPGLDSRRGKIDDLLVDSEVNRAILIAN